MVDVILWGEKPLSLVNLLVELKQFGYVVNKDYSFQYFPEKHTGKELVPRHTIFTFFDDNVASWFSLKYL